MLGTPAFTRISGALLIALLALLVGPGIGAPTRPAILVSTVCLNEFLPTPCEGGWEEFIELYNGGTTAIDISGWVLEVVSSFGSDTYTLPAGTVIGATAHLALFESDTGLALLGSGAQVLLLDDGGTAIDEKSYGSSACDLSIGRCPDGAAIWFSELPPSPGEANICVTVTPTPSPTTTPTTTSSPSATPSPTNTPTATYTLTPSPSATLTPTATPPPSSTPTETATSTPMPTPTPAASVTPSPSGTASPTATSTSSPTPTPTVSLVGRVYLSEFMPAPRSVDWDGDGQADRWDEWIELHNESQEDLDLGGCMLDDAAGEGSYPFVFPEGSTLLAGEYSVHFRRETSVILNNEGDSVRLLAPDGALVDQADYQQTTYDASFSRVGGRDGGWVTGLPPSPGEPNGTLIYLPLAQSSHG